MRQHFLLILIFFSFLSYSQSKNFSIKGSVFAETDSIPLEAATIYLEREKDTTLVTYTISDNKGRFELLGNTYDDHLLLRISSIGFQPYSKKVKVTDGVINFPKIYLPVANQLDVVTITSTPPITIKKDTLEFNVKSFKTKKDATVEDLLKQLPGVEVDDTGAITVNGKPVNKILVNGKPFFGDDPTITTRNLTKEIIEKVQITDTKTKSEAFTGEKGDSENQTINLTIKKENNKGIFGRVAAGAGTDDRYEFAGIVNYFNNDRRISALYGGNNINSPGFSFGEIEKMFGNPSSVSINSNGNFVMDGRSFGGGAGITTSQNAGVNYADVLAKDIDLQGDYFLSSSDSENETRRSRENILPDRRYFSNFNSSSIADSENHKVNMGFDIEIDSTFLVNIAPSFQFSRNDTFFNSSEETLDENLDRVNSSTRDSKVENSGKDFQTRLSATKKFGNKGGFIKGNINTRLGNTEIDDFLYSETLFESGQEDIIRDQYSDELRNNQFFDGQLTFRVPLIAKKLFANIKFGQRNEITENIRSTYDFNETTQEYSDFNTLLSTNFTYRDYKSKPEIGLEYSGEKLSIRGNVGWAMRKLESEDILRPQTNLSRNFDAVELEANVSYRFSSKASIYTTYQLSNNPPQLRQLQAFQDISDPLNVIIGNPNLKPENNHRFYLGFNNFDFQKRTGIFAHLFGNYYDNRVISKTVVDSETLARTTTYENVSGNYNVGGNISGSKTINLDTLRTLRVRVSAFANLNKNINYNNDIQYASVSKTITPNVRLAFNWKDVMEFEPNYSISFTNTSFDISDFEDRNFTRHTLGIRTESYIPKGFEWRNDISFNYNPNISGDFQKSYWSWNSTLDYNFHNDRATLSLKVYDLLNQNNNARRTSSENFIQDEESTVLRRYFMLSFSWKFNTLGKKGEVGRSRFFVF
ncbi:outer membrane beta-barrel protein [Aegicerativicinus sediminis]|uniref:outer membrane beta-barrel protein n=1 Tax=Aegicerativicinus sediminis TaxID=2893202 RepID=UPI001E4F05C3|nr:outer membrane beta-barrel protein [Aegicerativicinus sediminis]